MKIAKNLLLVLPLVAVVLMGSSKAHANRNVWLGYSGITVIGIDSVYGNAVAGLSNDGGETCTWYNLGWGGLDQGTFIYGTSGNDKILVIDWIATCHWCGVDLYDIKTNGYPLVINGRNGDDDLLNPIGATDVYLHGEGGSDIIWNANLTQDYNNHSSGGTGDDLIFVELWGFADGNGGNDIFCNYWEETYINGGNGTDYRIGYKAAYETSIEYGYGTGYLTYCEQWKSDYLSWYYDIIDFI